MEHLDVVMIWTLQGIRQIPAHILAQLLTCGPSQDNRWIKESEGIRSEEKLIGEDRITNVHIIESGNIHHVWDMQFKPLC